MDIKVIQDRFDALHEIRHGPHRENSGSEMCIMEATAWVAGEPWSDHPECVCPVIGAFMRSWNDGIADDATRTHLLRPLVPRIINTKRSARLERRRAMMAADWLVRVYMPAWLRLAGLNKHAEALSSLPEITDFKSCPSMMAALAVAQKDVAAASAAAWKATWGDAGAAARTVAWEAAWKAAWNSAGTAAMAAVGAAAWGDATRAAAGTNVRAAVGIAAMAAAGTAAMDAVRGAVRDAVRDALKPTQEALQKSAIDLIHRMTEATE